MPHSKVHHSSVLLIYTGGTIGMVRNPETGALESFNFDLLLEQVPELKRFDCRISTHTFVPPIDSSDMMPGHLQACHSQKISPFIPLARE